MLYWMIPAYIKNGGVWCRLWGQGIQASPKPSLGPGVSKGALRGDFTISPHRGGERRKGLGGEGAEAAKARAGP